MNVDGPADVGGIIMVFAGEQVAMMNGSLPERSEGICFVKS